MLNDSLYNTSLWLPVILVKGITGLAAGKVQVLGSSLSIRIEFVPHCEAIMLVNDSVSTVGY